MQLEHLSVGDTITFEYKAGSHPGGTRRLKVEEINNPGNVSRASVFGTDLDKNEPRRFLWPMMANVAKDKPALALGYIISGNGTIHLLAGKSYVVSPDHLNYNAIVGILNSDNASERVDELRALADIPVTIASRAEVVVKDGEVFYNGTPLHNVVTRKILEMVRENKPFKPLVAFLKNLMENPSDESREELYDFLDVNGLYIDPQGYFLGFKSVTDDYKDFHSKSVSNLPGTTNTMPREAVDDNRTRHCSSGFHVGSLSFANQFGSDPKHIMLVRVNPRDCVSVPNDANCQKLRVCEYTVVAEYTDGAEHKGTV